MLPVKKVLPFVITNGIIQGLAYVASPSASLIAVSAQPAHILNWLAAYAMGAQLVVFVHASGVLGNTRTEKYFDLTGSFTYISMLALTFYGQDITASPRKQFLAGSVLVWALRLGTFLFQRIHHAGGDSRFDEIKKDLFRFLTSWCLQGMWVFITMLAALIGLLNPDSGALLPLDYVGIALWLVGFGTECLADYQKSAWRTIPTNKGKFIDSGLWSLSRHPNYFGEMLLWIGVFISASHNFINSQQWIVGSTSPLFVSFLLIKVSGIPLLEKAADGRWGDDAEYKAYKDRVPVLIPFIGRRGSAAF